jgi:hypothetical protein
MRHHRGQEILSDVSNRKCEEVKPGTWSDHYIIQRECTAAKTSPGVPKNVLDKAIKPDKKVK